MHDGGACLRRGTVCEEDREAFETQTRARQAWSAIKDRLNSQKGCLSRFIDSRFHDPAHALKIPKGIQWGPELAVRNALGGGRIWGKSGPRVYHDDSIFYLTLFSKNGIISSPFFEVQSLTTDGHVTAIKKPFCNRGKMLFICKNATLYPNMGYDGPVPETAKFEAPPLYDQPKNPFPIQEKNIKKALDWQPQGWNELAERNYQKRKALK